MENYDRVTELIDVATNAEGRADQQFAKYADTVEYKTKQIANSWEQFRTKILDSETLKKGLDMVIDIMDKVSNFKLPDVLAISTWAITVGRNIAQGIVGGFRDGSNLVQQGLTTLATKSFASKTGISKLLTDEERDKYTRIANTDIKMTGNPGEEYNEKEAEARLAKLREADDAADILKNNLKAEKFINNMSIVGKVAGSALATAVTMGFTGEFSAKEIATTVSTQMMSQGLPILMSNFNKAFELLGKEGTETFGKAFSASGGWVTILLTLLSYIAAKVLPTLIDKWEEHNEKIKRANNKVYDIQKQLEELEEVQEKYNQKLDEANQKYNEAKTKWDTIEEAKDTYEELSSKIVLSEEETENLQNATTTLADQCPELIDHYDSMGNAVLKIGSAFDEVIEKQQKLYQEAELNQRVAALNANTIAIEQKRLERDELQARIQQTQSMYEDLIEGEYGKYHGPITRQDRINELQKYYEKLQRTEKAADAFDHWDWGDEYWSENIADLIEKNSEARRQFAEIVQEVTGEEANETLSFDALDEIIEGAGDNQQKRGQVYLKFLNEIFDSNEEYQERLDELNQQLNKTSIEQQAVINEQKQLALDLAESQWEYSGILDGLDDKIRPAIKNALSHSFLTEDVVNKLYEEARKENTTKDENGNLKLNEDAMTSSFKASISQIINGEGQALVNAYAAATPKMQTAIIDFYDTLGQVTLEESQGYIELVGGTSSQIGQDLQTALDENRKEIENYEFKLAKLLGETEEHEVVITNAAYGYDWQDSTGQIHSERGTHTQTETREQITDSFKSSKLFQYFDNLGSEQAAAFYNSFANMSASDIQRQIFLDNFEDFIGDLTEEQQKMVPQLMGIDWSSISLMGLTEAKDSFAQWYQELGGTIEEAEEKWEEYYEIAKQAGQINFTTLFDADQFLEDWTNELNKKTSAISGLGEVAKNQLTNGFISFADSKTVEEACADLGLKISDYIGQDANGQMVLDSDKLREDLATIEDSYSERLELANQEIDNEIERLKLENIELESLKNYGNENSIRLRQEYAITDTILARLEAQARLDGKTDAVKDIQALSRREKEVIEVNTALIDSQIQSNNLRIESLKLNKEELNNEDTLAFKRLQSQAALQESLNGYDKSVQFVTDSTTALSEATQEALEDMNEAWDTVQEKAEKLQETLYGTTYHKSKNDGLFNYNNLIDETSRKIDRLQTQLSNLSDDDDAGAITEALFGSLKQQKTNYLAENDVAARAMDNYVAELTTRLGNEVQKAYKEYGKDISLNLADYFTISDTGLLAYNYNNLNALQMSDDVKDQFEELANGYLTQYKLIEDNIDKITKLEQDALKLRKDAINNQVNLENEVVNVLKDKYQKQIDQLKNKYDAMKDADNDYVDALSDAIAKQRRLRDQENSWNDLANKERKLALMQRDTSGSNRADVLSLEREVQEDRTKLLDDAVDNIVDSLKEMYELQQESRDTEIEYMNAMLDNAALVQMANQIIESWSSEGDAISWFTQNVVDFEEKSTAYKQKEIENWKDLYNAASYYETVMTTDLENTLNVTGEDINNTVTNIAEHATSEASRSTDEFIEKLKSNIESAQTAYDEAYKSWEEKQAAYLEALQKEADAKAASAGAGSGGSQNTKPMGTKTSIFTKAKDFVTSKYNQAKELMQNKTSTVQKSSGGELAKYEAEKGRFKALFGVEVEDIEKSTSKPYRIDTKYIDKAIEVAQQLGITGRYTVPRDKNSKASFYFLDNPTIGMGSAQRAFAKGGLVNFTGPAWVDGTKSKPEAFLSSEDTERIGKAAKLLANLPFLNTASWQTGDVTTTNVGDTTFEIHINVENISSDYDVDQAVERVKKDIVDAANFAGRNVILKKA